MRKGQSPIAGVLVRVLFLKKKNGSSRPKFGEGKEEEERGGQAPHPADVHDALPLRVFFYVFFFLRKRTGTRGRNLGRGREKRRGEGRPQTRLMFMMLSPCGCSFTCSFS